MQSVRAKYERLLESAPDAMLFVNRDARIILINAQMEKLFGYSKEELVGERSPGSASGKVIPTCLHP
jgi:PAS domain S-box-containing protein